MSNKMLIDAIHPEETRVVVVRDKRVEDFDFEAASRKPLRGNIYLAKVTRVEPSLQAAFVEYGGNRHGFLAFSEIHPDYYQIPQADRAALLEEERAAAQDEEEEKEKPRRSRRSSRSSRAKAETATPAQDGPGEADAGAGPDAERADAAPDAAADDMPAGEPVEIAQAAPETAQAAPGAAETAQAAPGAAENGEAAPDAAETGEAAPGAAETAEGGPDAAATEAAADAAGTAAPAEAAAPAADGAEAGEAGEAQEKPKPKRRRRTTTKKSDDGLDAATLVEGRRPQPDDDDAGDGDTDGDGAGDGEGESVTAMGNSDALEEIPERRRRAPKKHYKIQEVIKRRQILLVQVVKEERGTKGAALTTYLSLAGRYSVLMPNTARGGGVSRKITDNADRKRLKSLVSELEVPDGMGIILRTAGAARTKTEIKRDFEYLLRLWESVRELTLKSIAPALVYEEGNLVKRAIRDLYSKEIDEVHVSGENAYREAKDFMKMLMPSHAKNVKAYREPTPIFTAYQIEGQLDAMFSPQVTLPSKGYIVINQTEALVAIDVNSGRSTKESNIEDTATKTNLEAADEVARQLRLRDLAGLIVIDFIDMDDKRHNRQVEKRLKDALKIDRSRIQLGRISPFGLMEMSRQRIRQGMVETSQVACPACAGTGLVRSTPSVALFCLRALEEHLLKNADNHVTLRVTPAVALYILNQKRSHLGELEERFQLEIAVDADETLSGQHLNIVTGPQVNRAPGEEPPTTQLSPDAVALDAPAPPAAAEPAMEDDDDAGEADGSNGSSGRRRRRRRRRRGGDGESASAGADADANETDDGADEPETARVGGASDEDGDSDADGDTRRRRRGRRGGRRHRRENEAGESAVAAPTASDADGAADVHADAITIEIADARPSDGAPEAPSDDTIAPPADADTPMVTPSAPEPLSVEPAPTAAAEPDAEPEPVAAAAADADLASASEESETSAEDEPGEATPPPAPEQKSEPRPRRVGWWQRRSFF